MKVSNTQVKVTPNKSALSIKLPVANDFKKKEKLTRKVSSSQENKIKKVPNKNATQKRLKRLNTLQLSEQEQVKNSEPE